MLPRGPAQCILMLVSQSVDLSSKEGQNWHPYSNSLLRLLPWSHFLHVTSAERFTLSQNSTEAAQKKFKSLACVAVPDTCSPVLTISLSSSSLERQLLTPDPLEWNVVLAVGGGRQWQSLTVFLG